MRLLSPQAFSLMEVILAAVVFTLAAAGFFTVLTTARQPVAGTDQALRATQEGRKFLEDLGKDLGEDTWMRDEYNPALNPHIVQRGIYTMTYNIEQTVAADSLSPKKIRLKVTW